MRNPLLGTIVTIAAAMVFTCGTASAQIGWAGNVWPLHDSNHLPSGPIDVYAQVWKEGVTDPPGQGAGIIGELLYTPEGGAQQTVAMGYQGDVGNNDEYTAQVPQAALVGVAYVDVTARFSDDGGAIWFEVTGDQQNNPPPLRYNVTNALPNDVDVTFTMCMSGNPTAGPPCVVGSTAELGNWANDFPGVSMNPEGSHPDLWTVTVTFLADRTPHFEHKHRRHDCVPSSSSWPRAATPSSSRSASRGPPARSSRTSSTSSARTAARRGRAFPTAS